MNLNDYDLHLKGWWESWKFDVIPKDFLPDNGKGGLMVEDGETPVCAGFMYATNSSVCWIDWIVSNKEYRKKPDRKNAIELLINSLTNTAKQSGYTYAYALIKNDKLVDIYQKQGYVKGVKYTEDLIKKLT